MKAKQELLSKCPLCRKVYKHPSSRRKHVISIHKVNFTKAKGVVELSTLQASSLLKKVKRQQINRAQREKEARVLAEGSGLSVGTSSLERSGRRPYLVRPVAPRRGRIFISISRIILLRHCQNSIVDLRDACTPPPSLPKQEDLWFSVSNE